MMYTHSKKTMSWVCLKASSSLLENDLAAIDILRCMSLPLLGKVSLVTGASRGIGAATAVKLALLGSDLAINYRNKSARAEQVCQQVSNLGRKGIAVQADLTVSSELYAMMSMIQQVYKRLDVLILNASGGLEQGKTEDYAMTLNGAAQVQTARAAVTLMQEGGRTPTD